MEWAVDVGSGPGPWAVSVCFFLLDPRSKHACVWNLGFLEPSGKSHRFSNQLWRVISVSDPRAGVPNMLSKLLTPQGGSPSLCNPQLFYVPS